MSFAVPRHVPSFNNPQRSNEDHIWIASGMSSRTAAHQPGLLHGVQDRVGNFLDNKKTLPMYKDKPYSYSSSRRIRPMWRRKRTIGLVVVVLLVFMYLNGAFGGDKDEKRTSVWSIHGFSERPAAMGRIVDWPSRRQKVVEAFELSWDAYERHAWGYDEFRPISKTGRNMAPKGLGWIIVDSLDTMILMNQTQRLRKARDWLAKEHTWEQHQDVNTFETTIRMLGGLLSAHYLSNEYPDLAPLPEDDAGQAGEDLYLEKAKDLADRLMAAFDSPSGIPYASVNLETQQGLPSHTDGGASSTAEAATLQLEFKYLAKLTGEKFYWDRAEKVMQVMDDNGMKDGLVPIFVDASSGKFRGQSIRLGSRGDSYYEYLIKQYLQTNKQESVYKEMWDEALGGVRKHLVTYTSKSQLTIVGERQDGLVGPLTPKMDHLVCFLPGTIALAVTEGLTEAEARRQPTWTPKKEEELRLARELTQTCWGMYKFMATGLAAEITYFNIDSPAPQESATHSGPATLDESPEAAWRSDLVVKPADVHNLQRPETVESLFFMWRITGDEKYREWGWEMFESFMQYTAVPDKGGFTSLLNANRVPPITKDNMESFWLAETLKYMYLLFSPADTLPLDKIVFNTEAHILPRFPMGHLFSTGWKRKARDANGAIIPEPAADAAPPAA